MRRTDRREVKENKEHDNMMQASLSLWLENVNTDEGKAEAKERDH